MKFLEKPMKTWFNSTIKNQFLVCQPDNINWRNLMTPRSMRYEVVIPGDGRGGWRWLPFPVFASGSGFVVVVIADFRTFTGTWRLRHYVRHEASDYYYFFYLLISRGGSRRPGQVNNYTRYQLLLYAVSSRKVLCSIGVCGPNCIKIFTRSSDVTT